MTQNRYVLEKKATNRKSPAMAKLGCNPTVVLISTRVLALKNYCCTNVPSNRPLCSHAIQHSLNTVIDAPFPLQRGEITPLADSIRYLESRNEETTEVMTSRPLESEIPSSLHNSPACQTITSSNQSPGHPPIYCLPRILSTPKRPRCIL